MANEIFSENGKHSCTIVNTVFLWMLADDLVKSENRKEAWLSMGLRSQAVRPHYRLLLFGCWQAV